MKDKIDRERLAHGLKILKRVRRTKPAKKFNLLDWALLTNAEQQRFAARARKSGQPVNVAINGCGSAACAFGWIASDPQCRKDGLSILVDEWGDVEIHYVPPGRSTIVGQFNVISADVDQEAASSYFRIGDDLTACLFFPSAYDAHVGHAALDAVIERFELALVADEQTAVAMICSSGGVEL